MAREDIARDIKKLKGGIKIIAVLIRVVMENTG